MYSKTVVSDDEDIRFEGVFEEMAMGMRMGKGKVMYAVLLESFSTTNRFDCCF